VQTRSRKLLMTFLVAAFGTQTLLVYEDDTPLAAPPLDELALRGRAIWHASNCHTCHQLYGFGGFLGPDLTNAAGRLTRHRLDEILTVGSGQMPAFHFSANDIDALQAFLFAMHETGVGQARRSAPRVQLGDVENALDEQTAEGSLTDAAASGRELFTARCTSCHRLFQATPLGPFMAPDLSDVFGRLGEPEVRQVVTEGRPERGMTPPPLAAEEVDRVIAFLRWLNEHRDDLAGRLGLADAVESVPWFEFK
jgi:nitric oxide reductase subunit C